MSVYENGMWLCGQINTMTVTGRLGFFFIATTIVDIKQVFKSQWIRVDNANRF